MKFKSLVIAGILALTVSIAFGSEVPALRGPVNDEAKVLAPDKAKQLSDMLLAQEKQTSNQIVVLTIKTLGGEPIESYAQKVFVTWKLGQAKKDNGVLIVVAVADHKMRIEVGKGLEGSLTDATSAKIIRDVMAPRFKANDFAGGLTEAVNTINLAIKGEFKADAPLVIQTIPTWAWILIIVGAGVVILLIIVGIRSSSDDMESSGSYGGGSFGSGLGLGSIIGSGLGGGYSGGHSSSSDDSSSSSDSGGGFDFGGGGDSGYSGGGGDSGGGGASGSW